MSMRYGVASSKQVSLVSVFFFQAEDGIRDLVRSRGLGDVYKRQDIPLNVSRSYLQADHNVKKINTYITKKVAEKLQSLFEQDRKEYESKWKEISVFVKYGMISDEKFNEKAMGFALLKNMEGEHFTIEEYKNKIKDNQTDKPVSYTHLRAHETVLDLVCRLLLETKTTNTHIKHIRLLL